MLEVKLFGKGQVLYAGRELEGFPAQQNCLLLCYLLLNRNRTHPRERLAAVFWGNTYTTPSSLKCLRNTLWRLRSAFISSGIPIEQYINVTHDTIAFIRGSNCEIDVEAFEDQVTRFAGLAGQELTQSQADELELAIELYRGDLLEGVDAEWCLYDRERLRILYLKALGKLMSFHRQHGSYERGLEYGERILVCDNTRERVHRDMMRLHWLAGDREAALEQYYQCVQALREELDILPMPETQALYHRILQNQLQLADQLILPSTETTTLEIALPDSARQLTGYTVQRLRHVEIVIEEIGSELQRLEGLVHHLLVDSSAA